MRKKIYTAVIMLSLATPAMVVAADNALDVQGSAEIGVRASNIKGNEARAQEFKTKDDSVLGTILLDATKGAYHFQVDGTDIGTEDQEFQFKGGQYDKFKYKFDFSEMTHNYGFDAITPFTGIGTHVTNDTATLTDISTWTHFDAKVDHKRYGGEVEISLGTPFFVNIGAERREQSGFRPYSTHDVLNADVPEPISTTTDNMHINVGYRGEWLTASVSGMLSSFNNDNKSVILDGADFASATLNDTMALEPDNDLSKFAADVTVRDLPLRSVLSASASYSKLDNSFTAGDLGVRSMLAGTWTVGGLAGLNTNAFDGEVDYTSFSIAVSSNPVENLHGKIYYKYLERENDSTIVTYTTHSNANNLLDYDKNTAGIDIDYKLPQRTKLRLGYEYVNMDRSTRSGLSEDTVFTNYSDGNFHAENSTTKDNTFYVELKNRALDWLTAKARYSHMKRDGADLYPTDDGFPQMFYYMDQKSDAVKLGLDLYPVDRLDLGLDYTYKNTDYDEYLLSRTGDTRHNLYLDATWHLVDMVSLTGFVGYEKVETDFNGILEDPQTYTQETNDDFWAYGLAAKVPGLMNDKLTLNVSWQWQESDGEINFNNSAGATYQDITHSDDWTKKTLEAKATYALDSRLSMTLGYLYERFKYEDISNDNFPYATHHATNTSFFPAELYFSGIYADQNYEVSAGYLLLTYKL
jgi:MtrB/PioB family decaheme-associated outer membrane protein